MLKESDKNDHVRSGRMYDRVVFGRLGEVMSEVCFIMLPNNRCLLPGNVIVNERVLASVMRKFGYKFLRIELMKDFSR